MLAILSSEISLAPDWTVLAQLCVFLCVMAVLWILVFKPTLRVIDLRKNFTTDALERSRSLNSEAEALENERKVMLAGALEEIAVENAAVLAAKRKEAEKIIADARIEAKRILDSTELSVEASEERSAEEINRQADMLAKYVVTKVIQ